MASHDKTETLCASCARAYARPDPAGCAFHRRDYLTRELEGHPYSQARQIKNDYGGRVSVSYLVEKCGDYRADSGIMEVRRQQKMKIEQECLIYELRNKGCEWRDVAHAAGCPVTTCYNAYKRYERRLKRQEAATC